MITLSQGEEKRLVGTHTHIFIYAVIMLFFRLFHFRHVGVCVLATADSLSQLLFRLFHHSRLGFNRERDFFLYKKTTEGKTYRHAVDETLRRPTKETESISR